MSDDWAPGDLAVCVDAGRNPYNGRVATALTEGAVYTVAAITRNVGSDGSLGLVLVEARATDEAFGFGFARYRFRKVRPDQHEPCEEEFAKLLNRSKRKVGA